MTPITTQLSGGRIVKQTEKLIAAMRAEDQVLVVMHDNPDPDAIASAWCVVELARHFGLQNVHAVAGGAIVRAENKQMVKLLNPPIKLVADSEFPSGRGLGAMLVDCGAGATNHFVTRSQIRLLAVIDHHQHKLFEPNHHLLFQDVREVAACASIGASYLIENDVVPSSKLATAIWYALRTETCAYESRYTALDRDVLIWATTYGSPSLLAEIENAPLVRVYFTDLVRALKNTRVYGDVAVCWLPQSQGVEVVGEVADLLVRDEEVHRVLCGTELEDAAFVSVRTSPHGGNATSLLLATLDGLGHGGGHDHRAGGKIVPASTDLTSGKPLAQQVILRWLSVNNVEDEKPRELLDSSSIV